MKHVFKFLLLFFFYSANAQTPITVCFWNLENFGKSKGPEQIEFMANTLKNYDVIAIAEVVAGNGGAQAVARLADELNRKGAKWDYSVSDPTFSDPYSRERYAFIWKTSKVNKLGDAWLDQQFKDVIEREPYMATFKAKNKTFTLLAFHAVPKSKQPETEIKYLKLIPGAYPDKNIIFSGDFNCPESHSVFGPLKKMGYQPVLIGQKTSLRQKCVNNDCLASAYDNIFYNGAQVKFMEANVVHFYESFDTLKEARKVSDHLPVYFRFSLN